MPPWAAPVWLRVGYSLVSTAVGAGPGLDGGPHAGPAGPDDDDVVAMFNNHWSSFLL